MHHARLQQQQAGGGGGSLFIEVQLHKNYVNHDTIQQRERKYWNQNWAQKPRKLKKDDYKATTD